ncbi:hypothetical protein F0P96_14285 [Hymenobacter busanensis]|uniref:Uncharacterized protein n=1 Tax=Hymenobacter busanensis TaxID=2607656 RepID=A0A7L5A2A4_9BACT|nr:hypothetical protein [Hymenobacter busanensis]KAA9331408.1 hypothetical protein F0P96_14285 [Hymenobacter busanensis]QHJ08562.1 hypothetical protein GUY19_15215 [Hymenobacter busanensis]
MSVRRLLPLAFLVVTATTAQAQKYRTAAGLRLGGGNYGLSIQQKIAPKATLEGLGILNTREVTGTLLAERHFPILGPSLNYYFGAGGHLGGHKDYGTVGGFDAIVGAEYKIAFIPFVVSFDFKPSYEINNDEWFRFPTAFSLRYVLIKEKKKASVLDGLFGGGDKEKTKKQRPDKKNDSQPRLRDRVF